MTDLTSLAYHGLCAYVRREWERVPRVQPLGVCGLLCRLFS